MRLTLGASIKEIISGMPDVSQCAFNSWRIPKREATEAVSERKARPAQYWSCRRTCERAVCMAKRLRVSVFVALAPRWCEAKQPSMCMSQQYCNHAHQGVSLSCGHASSMASTSSRSPPVDAGCASCAACIHSSFAKSCAGSAGCGGSDSQAAEERRRP